MARILYALPLAIRAAREGFSAAAFEKQLRELGQGARSSEVRALYKEAVDIVSRSQGTEPFQPLNLPPSEPMARFPTRNKTSVMQNVSLVYRDKTTGQISRTFYRVTSANGLSRQEAIDQAIAAYSDNAERYGQDLIGAVHTSAYRQVPFGGGG